MGSSLSLRSSHGHLHDSCVLWALLLISSTSSIHFNLLPHHLSDHPAVSYCPDTFNFLSVLDKYPAYFRWGPWHPGRKTNTSTHTGCLSNSPQVPGVTLWRALQDQYGTLHPHLRNCQLSRTLKTLEEVVQDRVFFAESTCSKWSLSTLKPNIGSRTQRHSQHVAMLFDGSTIRPKRRLVSSMPDDLEGFRAKYEIIGNVWRMMKLRSSGRAVLVGLTENTRENTAEMASWTPRGLPWISKWHQESWKHQVGTSVYHTNRKFAKQPWTSSGCNACR